MIILAGGFGERTRGVLGNVPKLLVETADGETILDHIVGDLDKNGLQSVIVTNGLFYDQIAKFVGKKHPNERTSIINDQKTRPEERLGALGDLLFAIDEASLEDGKELLVLPGDTAYWKSFLVDEFLKFASEHPDGFVTVVYDVGDKEKIRGNLGCAILDENSQITEFEEKPEKPKSPFAIIAIYLFRPEHVSLLRDFKSEGGNLNSPSNIIPYLMERKIKIYAYVSRGQVIDANSPEEIDKARRYGEG